MKGNRQESEATVQPCATLILTSRWTGVDTTDLVMTSTFSRPMIITRYGKISLHSNTFWSDTHMHPHLFHLASLFTSAQYANLYKVYYHNPFKIKLVSFSSLVRILEGCSTLCSPPVPFTFFSFLTWRLQN